MKISTKWLNKFLDTPIGRTPDHVQTVEQISDALTFHAFEVDGVEQVGDDDVFDIKVTPNRGHDCLSHQGIVRELAAVTPLSYTGFRFENEPYTPAVSPTRSLPEQFGSPDSPQLSVQLSTKLCKRYMALYVKGVKVGPSPAWLKASLEALGQRSINNVVDATNFVMFNVGQPLHAFDAAKLVQIDGKYTIEVRAAKQGEQMRALDEKEYTLSDSMLVITDANAPTGNEILGLAGVKGGMASGISTDTTDILVESANFDGVTTRKTAAALKLRTDASARFEQVLSPELCKRGIEGMLEFIKNVTGGEVVALVDVYPEPQPRTYISVTVEQVNKVLGTRITGAEIADVFARLGLAYKEQSDIFEVQPSFERLDLTIPEDLIEEVGRIIGYDKVPAVELPALPQKPEVNQDFYTAEQVREDLLNRGYSEVFTSVFAETGERTVLNKVDGVKPHLRTDIKTGLLAAWNKNIPNKDLLGLKEIKLFEIGTIWKEGKEEIHVATVDGKGVVEEKPLSAYVNESSADHYETYPISTAEQYKPFSRYPYIVRDVAFWIPEGTNESAVAEMIKTEAGELCAKISLFDRFQKGDKTSLAFRLIFQSFDKTLEDTQANEAMEKVYAALKGQGFEIR